MTFKSLALIGAALLVSVPSFATTYYGGFEDVNPGGDRDYNDIVFRLRGTDLSLHTSDGAWYSQPVLGTSGTPFWNNASLDGQKYNVGYCIYGGGNCNGGVALDPGANYLAKSGNPAQSATNVSFSVIGPVSADVELEITVDTDVLGWYNVSDPNNIHWLNNMGQTGLFFFNPNGNFGIAANNGANHTGTTFYSTPVLNNTASQFAFFGTDMSPAPEPGSVSLAAAGLAVAGVLFRKRLAKRVTN